MNYIELKKEINFRRSKISILQKEIFAISKEVNELTQKLSILEQDLFNEYLQLEEPITMKMFFDFRGIQINEKSAEKNPFQSRFETNSQRWSSAFSNGDIIKVIKKNKRSVVIECIKKNYSKLENGKNVQGFINPKSQFRVDIDTFRNFLIRDKTWIDGFNTWIQRKQSLDELLNNK